MKKVVLVTGGSSGIGRAIANYLSHKGMEVYGTSRKCTSGDKLDKFTLVSLNVTDKNSIAEALKFIIAKSGRLDVLVNNAGLGIVGPVENISDQEAKEVFDTNVFGVLNVCRACIPYIREQKSGYIVNITSLGGVFGLPYRGIYCSSKFAVEGFSEALSMELQPFGIKVCIVEPGDFNTNIDQNRKVPTNVDKVLYNGSFDATLNQINAEVKSARDPILIGKKIWQILNTSKPQLRYRVATPLQKTSIWAKRLLPSRLFEKLIMKHYKL